DVRAVRAREPAEAGAVAVPGSPARGAGPRGRAVGDVPVPGSRGAAPTGRSHPGDRLWPRAAVAVPGSRILQPQHHRHRRRRGQARRGPGGGGGRRFGRVLRGGVRRRAARRAVGRDGHRRRAVPALGVRPGRPPAGLCRRAGARRRAGREGDGPRPPLEVPVEHPPGDGGGQDPGHHRRRGADVPPTGRAGCGHGGRRPHRAGPPDPPGLSASSSPAGGSQAGM
ncbi:MAG: hypothetical protein AVDCRST_MAG10-1834, partial [uncultured Acidimicrobiales bacterium]